MNRRTLAVGRAVVVGCAVLAIGSRPSTALPRAAFQSSPVPGLAAYWPFDTSASDLSGNGNTGTLVSGATIDTSAFAPFPPGNVASLNTPATGDYVTVPTSGSLQITGSFTLAAWINTTATGPNQQGILEKWNSGTNQNGYFLRLNASNYLTFTIMPASGASVGIDTSPRAVPTGAWHHVAGVFDAAAGSMLMYVDGVADATQLLSGAPVPGADASPLRIGDDYGANNFLGHIDEARIYSTALTAAQVGTLMTGQLPPTGLGISPGPGQITLGWTGATAASSYNIYRPTGGGAYTLLANTASLGYTDLAVSNPTSYSYQVTAVGALESAPAGPVTGSPLPTGPGTGGPVKNHTLAHRCGCSTIPPVDPAGGLSILALAVALGILVRRR